MAGKTGKLPDQFFFFSFLIKKTVCAQLFFFSTVALVITVNRLVRMYVRSKVSFSTGVRGCAADTCRIYYMWNEITYYQPSSSRNHSLSISIDIIYIHPTGIPNLNSFKSFFTSYPAPIRTHVDALPEARTASQ